MKKISGLRHLLVGVLLVSAAGLSTLGAADAKPKPKPHDVGHHEVRRGPPRLPHGQSVRQVLPHNAPGKSKAHGKSVPGPVEVDAKLLVISADGNEAALPAITQALDYLGTPYTLWISTQRTQKLTADVLANGAHAFYQGVILTTGSLAYFNGTNWTSALTPDEWSTLWTFEANFGVRQVTWYTYPTPDYGFGAASEQDTTTTPLSATLTSEGRNVFSYLNAANPVQFSYAYCYKAPVASADTQALLVDAANNAIAAVRSYPDGRQNLALTCDSAPFLIHSVSLAYGAINWVTRGIFLGERRVYVGAQIDDYFLDDDLFTGGTYRMDGDDVNGVVAWQTAFRMDPLASDFRLDMAFNGEGATQDYVDNDTLVSTTLQQAAHFKWMSHTYTHANLDATTYAITYGELRQNLDAAANLPLPNFSPSALVTPDVSGLYNPNAMLAAKDIGIRWVVSDTSKADQANPKPNLGIPNALQPQVFEIPRRPNNLFYNVTTPDEWVLEYNTLYRSFWGRDLTYAELLDKESDVLLMYLLKGELDPWMFHQPNLRVYDGTHCLLGDLLDQVLRKYRAHYTLPWLSPTMPELGQAMADRTRAAAAGVSATLGAGTITLTAQQDAVVRVTGLNGPGATFYGGQFTTLVTVPAGKSVTLPLQ